LKKLVEGLQLQGQDIERLEDENQSLMNQATELQRLNEELTNAAGSEQLDSVYHSQYLKQMETNKELQKHLDQARDQIDTSNCEIDQLEG
jgi:predicted RNase H-like nuclease (RuvC/YqgF family)